MKLTPRPEQMQIEFDTGYKAGYVAGRLDGLRMGRAEGREQAAKVCEDERVDAQATGDHGDAVYNSACDHCAAAIRARGQAKADAGSGE